MDLSIIIVTWNVKGLLAGCLDSIYRHLPPQGITFEVWVVDNASVDNTVEMVRRDYPQVKLIANRDNLGFARANNQAIRRAAGRYIFLLNPDTKLIDGSLARLIKFADRQAEPCLVGPKLLYPDGSLQPSVRRFPRLLDQALILLKLHNFFPRCRPLRRYYMADFDYRTIAEVDQLMGAAILIPQKIFRRLGLLDERFWLLFEEVDFCQRVRAAGYKIYFNPQAAIIHYKGQSFKRRGTLLKQMNFNHNLFLYFKKHHPFYQLLILWFLQPFSLLLAALDQAFNFKKIFGKNPDL